MFSESTCFDIFIKIGIGSSFTKIKTVIQVVTDETFLHLTKKKKKILFTENAAAVYSIDDASLV